MQRETGSAARRASAFCILPWPGSVDPHQATFGVGDEGIALFLSLDSIDEGCIAHRSEFGAERVKPPSSAGLPSVAIATFADSVLVVGEWPPW